MSKHNIPKIGDVFNKLTVIGHTKNEKGRILLTCKCECGNVKNYLPGNVKRTTKSCGCYHKENLTNRNRSRGRNPDRRKTRMCWYQMMYRCYNTKCGAYKNYGGRGITVCDEWHTFENFLRDMGTRPKTLTLERMDNNKGYSPENCKWVTKGEQTRNRRNNKHFELFGEKISYEEAHRKYGISTSTIKKRLAIGLPDRLVIMKGIVIVQDMEKRTSQNLTLSLTQQQEKV